MKLSLKELSKVSGWFPWIDQSVFNQLLDYQNQKKIEGDLLEIGCYMGKSAIVIGDKLRKGQLFTVADLFNDQYLGLTQNKFEQNYLKFHSRLPKIIKGPSSEAVKHIKKSSCRFIHIDGSHQYEDVADDIANTKGLTTKDSIVVCDDYRTEHTPGVSAAVWQEVANNFNPICITPQKLYGTWGDPTVYQKELSDWLDTSDKFKYKDEEVMGKQFIRIAYRQDPNKKVRDDLKAVKQRLDWTEKVLAHKDKEVERILSSETFRLAKLISAPARFGKKILRR